MRFRLFKCVCNHRLRFGQSNCSYCFRDTPAYNRYWFWLLVLFAAALIAVVTTAL